ncbi:Chromosome partition protein Smc [Propionicimonas sp. T2.31MG-18]|uniref:DNA recombination protein RmuC n=1 Tax=Propionicimonas sp. T2.31MG-18 TaxID=3157620 RepID=UPI0035E94618
MESLAWLVVGMLVGALLTWVLVRARTRSDASAQDAEAERARAEAAQARAEAAQARAETARVQLGVAVAQGEAAQARAERASAFADLAEARAEVAGSRAERDAAVRRAEEIAADREQLVAQFKALSAETAEHQARRLDESAQARQQATDQLLTPVRESLQRFNDRLTEVEKERVAMATDLRNQVSEVKLTGETLRRETAALVTALRKPQVRGAWGELQLKRVVELAGMVEHCDFVQQQTTQTTTGATIRPDLKVTLTEGRFIYVDSKVPLSAFLDAQESEDAGDRARLLGQFAKNVQTHVDQLSRKDYYKADGGGTPEFVVLFLASEALAAEAFNQLPSLLEYASERAVMLATPSSLIAMLKTIAFSWRQAALAESAQEVFSVGRELYDRLGTLGKHFDKVGRSLTSAVGAYNDAVGSIEGRVFPAARKLRELKVTEKQLPAVNGSDAAVRPITATELVEDAALVTPLIGRRSSEELLARPQPALDDLLVREHSTPAEGGVQTA